MRARLILVLAVIAALAGASPAAARDRCSPKGSKTVKQTAKVRVFKTTRKRESLYYACLKGSGAPVRIGRSFRDPRSESSETVRGLRVAGTSVAIIGNSFGDIGPDGTESESILVADLRPGGRSFTAGFDTAARYAGFDDLILREDGAAAWVVRAIFGYAEVDVLGATAERATPVAYAKDIATGLAFGGDGVTWTQGGATRSAPIP